VIIRSLGRVDYQTTWEQMRAFTDARTPDAEDELWVCEHAPVFTQGVAGKPEHLLLNPTQIPVIKTDRGGQITYHGPGQAMVYVLFNLKRAGYGVREMVVRIENAVIAFLSDYSIAAYGKRDAPGVYVKLERQEAKIAALGLKVRNGHTYHGVAFNVNMDLTPFSAINPCGYEGLRVTHLHQLGVDLTLEVAGMGLADELSRQLTMPAK
jgi:lipoyl(octanoyl) transferase